MAKISIETAEVLERANGIFAWACEDDEMKKLTVEQIFSIALVNLSIEKRTNEKETAGVSKENPRKPTHREDAQRKKLVWEVVFHPSSPILFHEANAMTAEELEEVKKHLSFFCKKREREVEIKRNKFLRPAMIEAEKGIEKTVKEALNEAFNHFEKQYPTEN